MSKSSPKVFISYARADHEHVESIKHLLKEMKVAYWTDDSIPAGEDWGKGVKEAMENSDVFIACISPNYLSSDWSNFELGTALGRASVTSSKVIPLLLRPTAMPKILKRFRLIDAGEGSKNSVRKELKEALESA